ncbi:rhombosortase [Microbulbifer taiwanensis]|uniref:Rhombosortase n=1 Tax=Microbulbifer taiwanensis TaxID=986746 RepID=A0ABW1YQ30_9GAMM
MEIRKEITFLCGIRGPLLLLIASALLQLFYTGSQDWVFFDRAALGEGQWWRLLSGHLVHTNAMHLLLNGGAVAALWLLHGQFYRVPVYLGLVALLSLVISLGLWAWFPDVALYGGLSGVLHGLFCWGACRDMAQRRLSGALLLAGCWGKVAWELFAGPSAATAELIEAEVAVSSHLLGALAGSAIGLMSWVAQLELGGRRRAISP